MPLPEKPFRYIDSPVQTERILAQTPRSLGGDSFIDTAGTGEFTLRRPPSREIPEDLPSKPATSSRLAMAGKPASMPFEESEPQEPDDDMDIEPEHVEGAEKVLEVAEKKRAPKSEPDDPRFYQGVTRKMDAADDMGFANKFPNNPLELDRWFRSLSPQNKEMAMQLIGDLKAQGINDLMSPKIRGDWLERRNYLFNLSSGKWRRGEQDKSGLPKRPKEGDDEEDTSPKGYFRKSR